MVDDKEVFKLKMLKECAIAEDDLAQSRKTFKDYRDKFIAHLDSEETAHIPILDIPLSVVKFYYQYVATELGEAGLRNLPADIEHYYQECFHASEVHFGN